MLSTLQRIDIMSEKTGFSISNIKEIMGITPNIEEELKIVEKIETATKARIYYEMDNLNLSSIALRELSEKWLYLERLDIALERLINGQPSGKKLRFCMETIFEQIR